MDREGLGAEIQPMSLQDREPIQEQEQTGQCEKQRKKTPGRGASKQAWPACAKHTTSASYPEGSQLSQVVFGG